MLSYETHAGHGPFLLLIHGALSNSAQWQANISALSAFCRPVTAELLGHGDSPSPQNENAYTPSAYADYFETIRAELGTDSWFVCGYSLGAGLAINYALTHQQRISGLVFTNSMSAFVEQKQANRWQESASKSAAAIAQDGLKAIEKMPIHPRHAMGLPKALHQPLLARSKLLNPTGIAQMLAVTVPRASTRDRVAQNRVPALLLNGVREKRFQPYAEFAEQQMPLLTVERIEAGHGVNMQAPVAFNDAVQGFIASCA